MNIIEMLQADLVEKAWQLYDQATPQEQHDFLSSIANLLSTKQNTGLAISPQIVSVLHRDLKEGKSYQDFLTAWSPPGAHFKADKQDNNTVHYFNVPTQVINGENIRNLKELISIGLVDIKEQDLPKTGETFKETEAIRRERVSQVTENGRISVYRVLGLYTLGI